jgi:hypothetical protein
VPITRLLAIALVLAAACGNRSNGARRADATIADATPDATPFVITGPPTPEAAARAFVTAAARGDTDALRALAMTGEVNHALYDCSRRPDYELDRMAQRSVDDLVSAAEPITQLVTAREQIEPGAWTVHQRTLHGANTSMTLACDSRRVLAVVSGSLALTIVDKKGKRREASVSLVIVEVAGAARVNSAFLVTK